MRAISVPPKISSRCNAQCILKTRSSPSAGKGASLQISVSAPTAHQASAYRAICIEARLWLCRAAINLNAAFSPTSRTNHLTCAIALRAFERKLRRRAVNDATAIAARIVACHGSVAPAFWARLISRHNDPLQNSGRGRCGRRKGRRTRHVKHTPGRPRASRQGLDVCASLVCTVLANARSVKRRSGRNRFVFDDGIAATKTERPRKPESPRSPPRELHALYGNVPYCLSSQKCQKACACCCCCRCFRISNSLAEISATAPPTSRWAMTARRSLPK